MPAQPARAPHHAPRVANVRTARQATARRITRKARARYATLHAFCAALAAGLVLAIAYVTLTAKLTSLNYAVANAEHEHANLQAQAARMDDRLAALRSDDRLARLAARLHMGDPQQFALVSLPRRDPPRDSSHVALLSGLASLFHAR